MSMSWVAGVDEAGRGPLAGPVVAAAVILHPDREIIGLMDSKKLSQKKRELLFDLIQENAYCWGVAEASVAEIDEMNILQASLLAMRRAVLACSTQPSFVLVDGNQLPALPMPGRAIIKGDQTEPAISAASILAKVTRDRLMLAYDQQYPVYGFARHNGYPTRQHVAALEEHGVSDIHRQSYAPVRRVMQKFAVMR